MSSLVVEMVQCDFCLRRVSKHVAFSRFGYLSDGAGLFSDFCGSPGCVAEAEDIGRRHPGAQIFLPKRSGGNGEERAGPTNQANPATDCGH